ncbi:isoaspartyl peptidase/L-asparaginase family protein [Candidatus Viadribacter manganicus]|uniref:Isoaspartyl peptidase n=1 Tax=Candidatus Viadribacter manganicus TaxID=1759059 RepID=A0A1B1AHA6_9PROT|nr:isoaspartyl peptidase/L-asparaginase [Candidatus Viadribacter manganicus]ANP45942.1 asparaginase [Candidatus Viadribacter manganicus]
MRSLLALALLALAACATAPEPAPRWSLVVHGGAGVIERASLTPELEAQYRAAMQRALTTGGAILDRGGSSLDAVEAIIHEMEDDPLFNAGRGAVFTAQGRNELDASIMDGRTRAAGAVAGLTTIRHPISAARAVMERSRHVMLIGEGAETFARSHNLETVDPSYFFTERRWQQLEQNLRASNLPVPPRPAGAPPAPRAELSYPDDHQFGTVGVVALDTHGNIAAGTSTGGTTAKRWGRVGDAPIIGAGTYAQNGVCGVSATGTGEFFIRVGVARDICARMQFNRESAQEAADHVIAEVGATTGTDGVAGDGGVIVLDGRGNVAWAMNSPGMYRASQSAGGAPVVQIFADEE